MNIYSVYDVTTETLLGFSPTNFTLPWNLSSDHVTSFTPLLPTDNSLPGLFPSTDSPNNLPVANHSQVSIMPKNFGLAASLPSIIGLSCLFFTIVVVGIIGNCLVIVVILTDLKMRQSVTNLLIINLALADLIIMIFGVPEIAMFMVNRGWMLGVLACRINRFILVVALYSSVISLVVLCIERFIGIVFPLKVMELCSRKKVIGVIFLIWPLSIICGLPVILFNALVTGGPGINYCRIILPGDAKSYTIYKYCESAMFYIVPLIIQVVLYSIISKRLFASNEELCTRFQMRSTNNRRNDTTSDTIKARRGVVKMLISSVILYFISYSPIQIHLYYSTFAESSFLNSWEFFVFVMVITHINSAANPVLYGIFSQNFRRNFKRCLCSCCACRKTKYTRSRYDSLESRLTSMKSSSSGKTSVSKV